MTRLIRQFASAALFAAFAGVAAAEQAAATRPAPPPLPPNTTEGFFTTSDGVKIHYLLTGSTGSWVLLIHGYTDSAQRMWFTTGIAPALAHHHRVVALDNRNHGQSDRPQPGGSGRAQDVVELMDHLRIDEAHIHGYSMGGGMTGQLLAMIPQRFITAGFGGSGIQETDPALRAQAAAMDAVLPKPQGEDAAAMERFRSRVAQLRPANAPAPSATPLEIDLSKLNVPILAVNGSFDNPHAKTQRLWREAAVFQNVILAGKTHLTAISTSGAPPLYIESMVRFIDAYDQR
jgi:pimeloyl-ACP methyl ester carboxylesterase